MSAKVLGSSNQKVTWSETCGSVNQHGLYTAPPAKATCKVTATSQLNPDRKDTAKIHVEKALPVIHLRTSFFGAQPFCVFDTPAIVSGDEHEYTVTSGQAVTWKNDSGFATVQVWVQFGSIYKSGDIPQGETSSHTFTTSTLVRYRMDCLPPSGSGGGAQYAFLTVKP